MQENILDFREEEQQRPGQEAPPPGRGGGQEEEEVQQELSVLLFRPTILFGSSCGRSLTAQHRPEDQSECRRDEPLASPPAGSTSCLRLCPLLLHFLSAGVAAPPTGSEVQKVMLRWEGLCVWVGGIS